MRPLEQTPHSKQDNLRINAARLGALADSYDLFAIDLVVFIFELLYGGVVFNASAKSVMVSAMLAGVILGQLTFGYLSDLLGRKWIFVCTAALTAFGAVASALTTPNNTVVSLPVQLAVCRFFLGLGVGGDYPLAAAVTAEIAQHAGTRRHLLASVIAMQGFGMLLSSFVVLACVSLDASLERTWRTALAFGAFPSLMALVIRLQLHESTQFETAQRLRARDCSWTIQGMVVKLWWPLIGTSAPWFLMNIFQYSIGSFKSSLLGNLVTREGVSPITRVAQEAGISALISLFAIAGFGVGMILLQRASCASLQLGGFVALVPVFALSGLASHNASVSSLVLLLGVMFFFMNCGPNIGTFVIPADVFPTVVRATCHGFSAACGKIGAVLGTAMFAPAKESFGIEAVFGCCALVAFSGAVMTHIFVPREPILVSQEDEGSDAGAKAIFDIAPADYGAL